MIGLIAKGMPSSNGYVHVISANKWLEANNIDFAKRIISDGFVTQSIFAKRHGFKSAGNLKSYGPPLHGQLVNIDEVDKWLFERYKNRFSRRESDATHQSKIQFRAKNGLSAKVLDFYIRKGLPVDRGAIPVKDAKKWIQENIFIKEGLQTFQGFGREIKCSASILTSLVSFGMPVAKEFDRLYIKSEDATAWLRLRCLIDDQRKYQSRRGKRYRRSNRK